jgi:hypothetical protein
MATMLSEQAATAEPDACRNAEYLLGPDRESSTRRAGARRSEPSPGFSRHPLFVIPFCVALFVAFLALPATANESRTTLTLKADGSCVIRTESAQPRLTIEQLVRRQEEMKKIDQGDDEEEDVIPQAVADQASKSYTDEELAKKFRELTEERQEQMFQAGETKLESIDVKSNVVRAVTTQTFPSLEELLKNPYALWGQSGLAFESLRFEKADDGNLRITLAPHSGNARWTKNAKQMWKASKVNIELRFVLPGKVLSSGLPQTEGNATWLTIDAKKDETLAAASKLYDAPTVITAELGGLKIDAPLDSKTLQRQAGRRGGGEPELPITDAGPGFAAEAMSVTITTLHWFPEGQKHLKNASSTFGHQPTGAVVQAKLFAPKGRTLQSVTGVRVLHAVDDKGRPIASAKADDDLGETVAYSSGGRGQANSMQVQLNLPLPAADAQSIEQLDAEAIALTAGNWKEMTIPNVTANSTNEVDLGSVLPGAKLTIAKVTSKNRQTTVRAQIKGPPAIRQLEVQAKTGGEQRGNSWMNERGFKAKGAESTRNFTLQAYSMSEDGEEASGPILLVVRFPEDQKRERVKFSLKALDLL